MIFSIVFISVLMINPTLNNAEAITNFYSDYSATINGIQDWRYCEGNPIARKIFDTVNNDKKKLEIMGSIYLIGLSSLSLLPKPYNDIIDYALKIGHFYGGWTWRDTGYLKTPLHCTLLYKEW